MLAFSFMFALTSASSQDPALAANPLLSQGKLPAFDKIQAEHAAPAVRYMLAEAQAYLEQLEKKEGDWELIQGLNEIDYEIRRIFGPLSHLLGVKNNPALRDAYESVIKDIVAFEVRIKQSAKIYKALCKMDAGSSFGSSQRKRILELRLLHARHAGVALEATKQRQFKEIVSELTELSVQFSNNVLDATKAFVLVLRDKKDVEGLPLSSLELAAQNYTNHAKASQAGRASAEDGPWLISLDAPSYLPFMQHAHNRSLREKLYKAYISRASSGDFDNTDMIQRILKLRKKQAKLLGYSSFAQLRLDTRMAGKVEAVYELIEELRSAAWLPAQKEWQELKDFARRESQEKDLELQHWDIPYWAERLREKRFAFTQEDLRPYFPLGRVLAGLFELSKEIFGIEIRQVFGEAPVWHPDVQYFVIMDQDRKPIASFYLDPYSRPQEKRGGAWMDECVNRCKRNGKIDLPVAYLVCNASPPVGKQDAQNAQNALMNFREVETLLHEFGHGLQHMLTRIDEADISGINGVEWDAVELPSQFMENWCYHRPTLTSLSEHVTSKEKLPAELFEKIQQARTYRAASNMLRQLGLSLIDMELHDRFDPDSEDIAQTQKKVDALTSLLPPLPEDRFLCAFSHIFAGSYAAGYYSYKWAEVLSADCFSAFEEAGLDKPQALKKTGMRFRDTILALGGSQHPEAIFQAFRGRKATTAALLRHSGLTA